MTEFQNKKWSRTSLDSMPVKVDSTGVMQHDFGFIKDAHFYHQL